MTKFYDSVSPAKIPAGAYAAVYIDGDYAASAAEVSHFAGVQWITVLGSASAGLADYEDGNAIYSDSGALEKWAVARVAAGYRPVVYANRSDLARAVSNVGSALSQVLWWIPTLDNKQWTAAELVADVGLPQVTTANVWANQYAGGVSAAYDTSNLFGSWSLALTKTAAAPGDIYVVKEGDNLSEIAQTHGVTLAALEAANPQITDPNLIYPGQQIKIPAAGSAPDLYTVQRGDNLSDIAASHGVTLAALEAANPQIKDPNLIYPGQVINIP